RRRRRLPPPPPRHLGPGRRADRHRRPHARVARPVPRPAGPRAAPPRPRPRRAAAPCPAATHPAGGDLVSDETPGGSVARRAPRRFEPRGRRVTILDEADGQVAAAPGTPSPAPARRRRLSPWGFALAQGAVAYVISRAMVLAAAGAVAAAQQPRPTNAKGPILNVLTSWDGLWYFEIVRHGYPTSGPSPLSY